MSKREHSNLDVLSPVAVKSDNPEEQTIVKIPTVSPENPKGSAAKTRANNAISYLGCRVARFFDKHKIYYGNVYNFSYAEINEDCIDLWSVLYDDGDREDLDEIELNEALNLAKPAPLNSIGIEYVHLVQYRMTLWMQHYPERAKNEVLCKRKVTRQSFHKSSKFSWKLAACGKMGNVYRHLDTGTHRFGEMVRLKVGGAEFSDPTIWTTDQIQQAVVMAIMKMTGFKPEVLRKFFKSWNSLPVEACFPSTVDELKTLRCALKELKDQCDRPRLFHAKFQTQGFRWIEYFRHFNHANLASTVRTLRQARTWKDAVLALQTLPGVGPYSAAQSLCDLFMGVWQQRRGLFKKHILVVASMNDGTGIGPGPIHSLNRIFPNIQNKDNALKILRESMKESFKKEGLDFPHLKSKYDTSLEMSCVDLEHSLCYFHRYYVSKQDLREKDINVLYQRFQDPSYRQMVSLPSIKELEQLAPNTVKAWCDARYERFSKRRRI